MKKNYEGGRVYERKAKRDAKNIIITFTVDYHVRHPCLACACDQYETTIFSHGWNNHKTGRSPIITLVQKDNKL